MSATAVATELLLHPPTYDPAQYDEETRRLLRATIEHFESRGKAKLTADFHAQEFHADFLAFVARERMFSTLLTPAEQAGGNPEKRWDTARIAAMSEVLGFYGINYWYPWQVTALGLGPVWQSANDGARARAAKVMEEGGVAAFGLSEREHGADIYSSDMVLTPDGSGGYTATGGKYYIGNGNCAGVVSVFGRVEGVEGPISTSSSWPPPTTRTTTSCRTWCPRRSSWPSSGSRTTRWARRTSCTSAPTPSAPRSTRSTSASSTSASAASAWPRTRSTRRSPTRTRGSSSGSR